MIIHDTVKSSWILLGSRGYSSASGFLASQARSSKLGSEAWSIMVAVNRWVKALDIILQWKPLIAVGLGVEKWWQVLGSDSVDWCVFTQPSIWLKLYCKQDFESSSRVTETFSFLFLISVHNSVLQVVPRSRGFGAKWSDCQVNIYGFCISIPYAPWCWNIYLHFPQKLPSFVGKYSSTMEPMGIATWSPKRGPRGPGPLAQPRFPIWLKKLHPSFCADFSEISPPWAMMGRDGL